MSHHIGHPHFHCLRACLANKWKIDEKFVENFCANRGGEKKTKYCNDRHTKLMKCELILILFVNTEEVNIKIYQEIPR